jgi:hypothetical protein
MISRPWLHTTSWGFGPSASASGSLLECESEHQDGRRSLNLTSPSSTSAVANVDPSEDCVSSDRDKSRSESAASTATQPVRGNESK